jgi:hypothetical protein
MCMEFYRLPISGDGRCDKRPLQTSESSSFICMVGASKKLLRIPYDCRTTETQKTAEALDFLLRAKEIDGLNERVAKVEKVVFEREICEWEESKGESKKIHLCEDES